MSDSYDGMNSGLSLPCRLRVLVADDEPSSRDRLVRLLSNDRDIDVILQAEGGMAAVAVIKKEEPHIVFLDIQMSEVDGFGIIEAIGIDRMPPTIFVAASERLVSRAWDFGVTDYLLKPFRDARFYSAMRRAKTRLLSMHLHNQSI